MTLKADYVDGDSYSTAAVNAVAAALNVAVTGSDGGTPAALTLWIGSQAEYDALSPTYDAATVYVVV